MEGYVMKDRKSKFLVTVIFIFIALLAVQPALAKSDVWGNTGEGFAPNGAPLCNGQAATIYVSAGFVVGGPDNGNAYAGVLNGTSGADVMIAPTKTQYPASNTINGFDGDDTLCSSRSSFGDDIYGDLGSDYIKGSNAPDFLAGQQDGDYIDGGGGADDIAGGPGDDTVYGSQGVDNIATDGGSDWIDGGHDNDTIDSGSEADIVYGGGGNDTIYGGWSGDWISGGDGDDYIEGGGSTDDVWGDDGNDTIYGDGATATDPQNDHLYGGNGDDNLTGDGGSDTLDGEADTDTCDGEVELNCEI